ncbi:MAG: DUF1800 family protein [Prosthecobacter sp.]|nr:DUF1800 family protein [Prosthecobacter sp.]
MFAALSAALTASAALDQNGNQQSDIWEAKFSALGLPEAGDFDSDGFTNRQESLAGTDPRSPYSRPGLGIEVIGGQVQPFWSSLTGKSYQLLGNASLDPAGWQVIGTMDGSDAELGALFSLNGTYRFFRLQVLDLDTDGDGLSNWEEASLGFDPATDHTQRFDQTDFQRVNAAWTQNSSISVAVLEGEISERWPDMGTVAIRRTGGMKPITVNLTLGGNAALNSDYTTNSITNIAMPAGIREVWVEITPLADEETEATETITVMATSGTGYTVTAANSGAISLANETAAGALNAKAAIRFLMQAAFGPDQDDIGDADLIPENAEQVMQQGFEGWIDAEFAKPATHVQPFTEYAYDGNIDDFYTDSKMAAWWSRVMGSPTEIPGGPPVAYDVLRQRIAFCLSQILVTSDRPEVLAVEPVGMANYYDMLIDHSFGNYRDLLYHVTRHPVMGFYLSALKNQKPDPVNSIYPDENYAREIMQLFSIGLWELNQDGSRKVDGQGQFIPTYSNTTITNFARVFTGMTFDNGVNQPGGFLNASNNWLVPMKLMDAYHDCDPKTLLNGMTLPARDAGVPNPYTATDLDLNAAIDNLFNHPNVGPFIGRQLIQRLVTSNPSAAYIGRVAAKFADNGSGVRGDMKAVIKAILLDTEARDPAKMSDPQFGKVREPFLRVVNLARAFNATSVSGFYPLDSFFMDHYEEPMKSLSVFNFYLPAYAPPGEIQSAGLVAPEMQVVNATSAISAPNYYYTAILSGLHRWGVADPDRNVKLNLAHELTLVDDPDALIRRLDMALTGGTLTPKLQQVIREAVERISSSSWEYENERLRLAIWLIVTSPEYCVLR